MRPEHWLYTIPLRLRSLFRREQADQELDEELRDHVEQKAAEYAAKGMTPQEARRMALLEMGGIEKHKEECREARRVTWLQDLLQDLRFGLRMLRKSPGFTAVAVLTLALGIGANTAIFSIVDSLLLRPLPVKDPGQLTVLAFQQGNGPLLTPFSIADYRDIRAQTTNAFSDMLGYQVGLDGLSINGEAERVLTNYVAGNYFSMLGLKPYLGRLILPSEGQTPGADPVIVLSYSYWENRFSGDRSIIGKKVLINGQSSTVVGVAPPGFDGVWLYPFASVQVYLPLAMVGTYKAGWPSDFMVNRVLQNLEVMAALKPGVSLGQANAALAVVAHRLSAQYPKTDKSLQLSVYPERLSRPTPAASGVIIKAAGLFFALVALVLLLACVNITNILLVRGTIRAREMAIRTALGAGRSRLLRQLLTESVLLAFLGGLLGMFLGLLGSRAIASIPLHESIPFHMEFGFDWRIFFYAFAAALLTGVFVGLVPALRVSRTHITVALHESGRSIAAGKNRLRNSLVIVQVAGSLMLLIIAALFTQSLVNVQHSDLGFDPHHVVDFTMDPSELGYTESQGLGFYNSLLDRVRALPGAQSAAYNSSVPMNNQYGQDNLKIPGYQNPPGQPPPLVFYSVVSAGYFDTMRIPILQGRSFTDADTKGAAYVAIVNETFAKRFWPNQNPIGQHFAKVSGVANPLYQVVGVAKDSHLWSLTGPIDPCFYLPLAQDYAIAHIQTLQVRTSATPDVMIRDVQDEIRALAPALAVFNVETMMQSLDDLDGFMVFKIAAGFAAILGLLGLILAIVGVYGVISYSVSQRTHEIGIRVALGAQRSRILRLILSQGILIVGAGLLAGCAGAFLSARLIANFLVNVSFADPLTYFGVAAVLALIALLACYIPARRAMRVDPMVALRYE